MVKPLGQQLRMLGLVVDAAHQRVFDTDAALGGQPIIVRGIQHLRGVETLVHRHQLVTQFVAGGMQGNGQTHGNAFGSELLDAGDHAHRGYGDVARGNAEAFGRHGGNLSYGGQHGVVVAHRLAHAHEHDVAQAALSPGHFAVAHHLGGHTHLFDYFTGGHVTGQAKLAGGAERAAHAAADLRGDAQRGAGRVSHKHRFDEGAVEQLPQGLDGGAFVRHLAGHLGDELREKRGGGLAALGCRKISEFGGIHIEMAKVMVGELLDSELRQSEFGRFLDALLGRHIHKVQRRPTTAGMVLG